ncbi:MAG: hypothetical protein M0Q93_00220 [Terrimicrobiaceae bacterium]|nr:hypothetical protein [Terrimicrobiaceae bacterium]
MTSHKLRLKKRPTDVSAPGQEAAPSEESVDAGLGSLAGFSAEDLAEGAQSPEEVPSPEEAPSSQPVFNDSHIVDWVGRDVFVGFPCYKQTNPATAWCLLASALDYGKEKLRFDLEIGDAMIYHARNRLVQKFLETPAQWLLFVDDDMIFPIGRPAFLRQMGRLPLHYPDSPLMLNSIERLLSHKQPLVGATYFTRNVEGLPVNALRQESNYLRAIKTFEDRIFPCEWTGTGMMLIHRSVFETIQKQMPELETRHDPLAPWEFFLPVAGQGEDVAFCQRAKACGILTHVDSMLQCLHVGYGVYGVHTSVTK